MSPRVIASRQSERETARDAVCANGERVGACEIEGRPHQYRGCGAPQSRTPVSINLLGRRGFGASKTLTWGRLL
jgi:hypothetical protein